jgi:hypothetical protein
MVCWQMGLLDDAIREHLELKRRRGADAGEIAHQEHAALDPVFPPEDADATAADAPAESSEPAQAPAVLADANPVAAPQIPGEAFHAGQETAEIDMQAVLDGEDVEALDTHTGEGSGRGPVAARAPQPQPGVIDDDALEWEMPGDDADLEAPAAEIPGQERMSFE